MITKITQGTISNKVMETNKKTLVDINKEVPFKVPENYFSQFNESIMTKLPEKEVKPIEPVTLWDKSKTWIYMAAMFFGLFFTVKVLVTSTDTLNPTHNIASTSIYQQDSWDDVKISEEEFFDYLETQFVDENYYDLVYNQVYLNSL